VATELLQARVVAPVLNNLDLDTAVRERLDQLRLRIEHALVLVVVLVGQPVPPFQRPLHRPQRRTQRHRDRPQTVALGPQSGHPIGIKHPISVCPDQREPGSASVVSRGVSACIPSMRYGAQTI
jgi:hypothetical protein